MEGGSVDYGVDSGSYVCCVLFFFFQAEDGIRDLTVTGVQTCALPILGGEVLLGLRRLDLRKTHQPLARAAVTGLCGGDDEIEIGRAACRERGWISVVAVSFKKKNRGDRLPARDLRQDRQSACRERV